ncbi:MAG TPA: hypothetical protein PK926_08135 [Spirochaetota bacterium]|nr:hypothetical protein [Spirochaetota bacterium]HPI88522.1 hypothetical protein [Spirochaetota bacterium]HPR48002.1 hypothetical protein [Spirochaetota bacterium]
MEEIIFNCYAIVENELIREIAINVYCHDGSDEEKKQYLAERAIEDYCRAEIFSVPENFLITDMETGETITGIPWIFYRNMLGTAEEIFIFEKAFQAVEAPMDPLCNISVVINGIILPFNEISGNITT